MCDSSRTLGPLPAQHAGRERAAVGHQCGAGWIRGSQQVLEPPRPFGPKPEPRPRARTRWSAGGVGGIWAPPTRPSDLLRKLSRPGAVGPGLRRRGGRLGYSGPRAGSGRSSKHRSSPPLLARRLRPRLGRGGTRRRRVLLGGSVVGCTRKLLESQAPRMDACVQFWWQGLRRLEGRAWWTLVF